MIKEHGVSQRQACKTVSLPRSTTQYNRKPKADEAVIAQLQQLVEKHPAIGFGKAITVSGEKVLYGITRKYTGFIPI